MKPIYTVIETPTGGVTINADLGNGHMLSIPSDPANSDYQAYLAWLEDPEATQFTPIDTEDE
jgi:hypothetical protein